ncbi:hypothetical protein GLOTRDRAFT_115949 [Gloeophyllum trabeum ATCC 11539]|uniref:Ubiquitin 3 binding protein But2 C-terminal domain-containing protein n=1 Tax=Gloeophyllum trabeum (strain ATCC 11539 / FP-39264 / Madison 617) TaxID=670483 RepID=S7RRQ7_GLOTA|nr:uncharacterized protein GLOTRDRAFT_115949 [Gloeophyllum trabeum ATCC 11539]EPQ55669.1 hypothetical protein GLOTRDRAFT_115949 [Gloeophyllum trabeum ATCC 11539]
MQNYRRLPSEEEADSSFPERLVPLELEQEKSALSRNLVWLVVACALCTVANIAATGINMRLHAVEPKFGTPHTLKTIRRPNQFIGLDKVERGQVTYTPFANYPALLTQVDASNPNYVYSDDPLRWKTSRGSISPDDRRVLLTATVSTIAQFRILDYGMERCELMVQVAADQTLGPESSMRLSESFANSSKPEPGCISVWRLDAPEPLDPKRLWWRNKPTRISQVAAFDPQVDPPSVYRFDCVQDSLHSFEIVAEDESCYMEWWQDKGTSTSAIYLQQSMSV